VKRSLNRSAILEALMILLGVISVLFVFHLAGSRKAASWSDPSSSKGLAALDRFSLGSPLELFLSWLFSSALIALISSAL
jgi:hypothetical protein